MNKGEVRLAIVIALTVGVLLFFKYIVGDYVSEAAYIWSGLVIAYFLFKTWKREKRKKQKNNWAIKKRKKQKR